MVWVHISQVCKGKLNQISRRKVMKQNWPEMWTIGCNVQIFRTIPSVSFHVTGNLKLCYGQRWGTIPLVSIWYDAKYFFKTILYVKEYWLLNDCFLLFIIQTYIALKSLGIECLECPQSQKSIHVYQALWFDTMQWRYFIYELLLVVYNYANE